jgi:tRNA (mo5U34)-methyltransferase
VANLADCVAHGIQWFHSFDLPDGESIKGYKSEAILRREAAAILPDDLTSKSVLDIGAWDGYFSFEAERRGAADVLATDHFCWSGPGWGTKDGFDFIHSRLGSKVRSFDVEPLGLTPEKFGQFDVVLFLGVLYHVTDIYRHLEAAAAMCRDHLVVETETTMINTKAPLARFIQSHELGGDPTNFWAPNPALVRLLLERLGFSRIDVTIAGKPHAVSWLPRADLKTRRMIVHAYR